VLKLLLEERQEKSLLFHGSKLPIYCVKGYLILRPFEKSRSIHFKELCWALHIIILHSRVCIDHAILMEVHRRYSR
jgi:hypothetical protein